MKYFEPINSNSYLVEVHIADLHFGAVDPLQEFTILKEQFLDRIALINFDILSIDGDIFDKKLLANSQAIYYAMEFVRMCAALCIVKQATLVLISGTESHDAGQLQLFYAYKEDQNLDIRIIEHAKFEYIKGLKVLCLPEEYGKGQEYYSKFLDDIYDTVFMHGAIVGGIYGASKEDLNSSKYPVFSLESFGGCRGPIIAGHVHKAMCLNSYMYYCSNPIRYRFGEEEEKGFCIICHDRTSMMHTFDFIPIKSFRYDTIHISSLPSMKAEDATVYFDNLLTNGIDNIRIDFTGVVDPVLQKTIEQYYSNNANVSIKRYVDKETPQVNTTEEIEKKYADLDFLLDPNLDGYTKFVNFINYNMGSQYITVEKLKDVLNGGI